MSTSPLPPVDTSSPRATFNSFRIELEKAYRAWRLREHLGEVRSLADRVLRTLDLHEIGEAFREDVGIDAALFLYDTIAKLGMPPLESIPDAQAVAAQGLTEWTFPGTDIKIVKIAEGEHAGQFLFSAESVRRARQLLRPGAGSALRLPATSMRWARVGPRRDC